VALLINRAAVSAVLISRSSGSWLTPPGTLRQLRPLSVSPQLQQDLEQAGLHPRQGACPPVAITTYHESRFVFLTGPGHRTDRRRRAASRKDAPGHCRGADAEDPSVLAPTGAVGHRERLRATTTKRDDVSLTDYAPSVSLAPPAVESDVCFVRTECRAPATVFRTRKQCWNVNKQISSTGWKSPGPDDRVRQLRPPEICAPDG
jgi:hypothetical protein